MLLVAALLCVEPAYLYAQGGRGGRGVPPPAAQAAAPVDVTGYWTAVITEDWHQRMMTAPRGDFGSGEPGATAGFNGVRNGQGANPSQGGNIPYKIAAAKLAMQWDPAKDEAAGEQCKAYGAGGVMRLPTHLHITWQDDNTLRVDTDAGSQTRLFHFVPAPGGRNAQRLEPLITKATAPAGTARSWQGYSVARWTIMGGAEDWAKGGSLEVITTDLKPGYYWKNGMPYSENLVLTEHFRVLREDDGTDWLYMSQMAEDPDYLTEPWIITYQFKKLPDGSRWNPTPCSAR
jgi:hypothetical protein